MNQPATSTGWDLIEDRISDLRNSLLNHPVYGVIRDLNGVQLFMQSHVFAVWDFMSLLKVLQQKLCCTAVPWVPPTDPTLARLINEIVLAEETDENQSGNFASHFDLYRSSMIQAGANVEPVDQFLRHLNAGDALTVALGKSQVPQAAQTFVNQTFEVIETGHLPSIAAAFTFGREDLLPDLFRQIIANVSDGETNLSEFIYYLDRHVELDGDEHGPLAKRLVNTICGTDDENWRKAEAAVVASLESRLALWDAMHVEISTQSASIVS